MESLAHYKLGDHVGTDRLADVYRATDTTLGRTVTIKILRPDVAADSARRDALLAAARAVLPLSHPNIAVLFQVGEEDGKHFLVFEHTPGETLRAAIAGSPLNLRRAVDLGVQLADALADAHGQGFVHGALNPDSIVVTQKGRVKVLGFGLPSFPADQPIQSDTSLSPDDVECLAPERVLGERGDARADIFSLGCVLFEMLTGRQPFGAATASDTAVAILGRTPPPPSQFNARVPVALDRIVERCLVKSVDRRCESAATVAAELREIAAQMEAHEQADTRMPLTVRPSRRRPIWLIVLLILLCLAGLSAAAAFWLLR
jgi:serine/threonine-protein kinase